MNFDFSEEQHAIKEQAGRVLGEYWDPASRREAFEGNAAIRRRLWDKLVELGWTAVTIPEAYGGLGLGYVSLCALAEELGRGLASSPFRSSVFLATEAILLAGNEAQKADWLPALARGERVATLAFAETPGSACSERIDSRVDGGRITGAKIAVADADAADAAIVAAKDETGRTGLYLVRLAGNSVVAQPQQGIDPNQPLFRIEFRGALAERLDAPGGYEDPLESVMIRAAVPTAFEQLGGAAAALLLARDYALERHAFGQPIGAFQAIKHRLAEAHIAIELARSHCYYGAWALESGADELPVAAAAARVCATNAYEQSARDLIQVHGGIGMTWEHDSHLYYRHSRHLAAVLGDRSQWKSTLLRHLLNGKKENAERAHGLQ